MIYGVVHYVNPVKKYFFYFRYRLIKNMEDYDEDEKKGEYLM